MGRLVDRLLALGWLAVWLLAAVLAGFHAVSSWRGDPVYLCESQVDCRVNADFVRCCRADGIGPEGYYTRIGRCQASCVG